MRIVGVNPAFMRPPFGAYNDDVRRIAASRNQTIVIWDFDSGDSSGVPPAQRIQGYTDLAARHPLNVLTLNHEVSGESGLHDPVSSMTLMYVTDSTALEVLPNAIRILQARGYQLVTVAECLGMAPYQSVRAPENVSGASQMHVRLLSYFCSRAHGLANL
jgi:peptidoglycan/xylan/chitin deacetylase (PgdA/CDA1 family)